MIKKRITLVLGAGASKPYGFPTGLELMQEILDDIKPNVRSEFFKTLRDFDITEDEIDSFYSCLSDSGLLSVDAVLEHRTKFMRVGKIAMTLKLSEYEIEENLFKLDRTGKSWYQHLWIELNVPFDEFDKQKLSIITFNYDRSLEHYLYTKMRKLHSDKPESLCADKIKSIPIIHVHGQLGEYWEQDDNWRSYEKGIFRDQIEIISEQLKVVTEDKSTSPEYNRAHQILSKSSEIHFLGFGYHLRNLERLKIKNVLKQKRGSGYNLSDGQALIIRGNSGIDIDNEHGEILDYLKNNVNFR